MEAFLDNVISPSWWFSVVVVGILINLASAYFKPFLDRIASRVSDAGKRALTKERQVFEEKVCRLLSNPISTVELKLDILNWTLLGVGLALMGTVVTGMLLFFQYSPAPSTEKEIGMYLSVLYGSGVLVVGLIAAKKALESHIFLHEVQERRAKVSGSEQGAH